MLSEQFDKRKEKEDCGESGHRYRYLPHAKRALYYNSPTTMNVIYVKFKKRYCKSTQLLSI